LENENSDRRRFVRKLVSVAALGGLGALLLGRQVEKVSAAGGANQIAYYTAPDTYTGSDNLRWYDTDRNFVAGYSGNTVATGVVGATISGGGSSSYINKVTDDYGTVGGGRGNQAGDNAGTTSDRLYATVGGGVANIASGVSATVGGGYGNTASGSDASVAAGRMPRLAEAPATQPAGIAPRLAEATATQPADLGPRSLGEPKTLLRVITALLPGEEPRSMRRMTAHSSSRIQAASTSTPPPRMSLLCGLPEVPGL